MRDSRSEVLRNVQEAHMDTGLLLSPALGRTAAPAQRAEASGFSSLLLTDSQNLAPEVWSHLHLADARSSRSGAATRRCSASDANRSRSPDSKATSPPCKLICAARAWSATALPAASNGTARSSNQRFHSTLQRPDRR